MNSVQSINGTGYYNQVHGHNKPSKGDHKNNKLQQRMNQIHQGASSFGISLFSTANTSQATKTSQSANNELGRNLDINA